MVAQAPSGKKPLPDMMTSIRFTDSGEVEMVDQLLLPCVKGSFLMAFRGHTEQCQTLIRSHTVNWFKVSTPEEAFDAIKTMKIRGAPAIASLAALSLRSHLQSSSVPKFDSASAVSEHVSPILDYLQSSRPTAVNLGEAMDRIRATLKDGQSGSADELVQTLKDVCTAVHGEDLERCRTMCRLGAEWLWNKRGQGKNDGLKLVTVCNTGSLATSVRRCCAFLDLADS